MVIDIEALSDEISELEKTGISTKNIKISDRATITFPFHRLEDNLEEDRLGGAAFGSTRRRNKNAMESLFKIKMTGVRSFISQ